MRFKEHQLRLSSAFHEHLLASGHSISLSDTAVLDSESNFTKRKVKEAIEIRARHPSLNRDLGYDLPPIYNSLINSKGLSNRDRQGADHSDTVNHSSQQRQQGDSTPTTGHHSTSC